MGRDIMPPDLPSPTRLRLRPETLAGWVRLRFAGDALLARQARTLANLPPGLTPAERAERQREASRVILRHLGVRLESQGLEHARGGPFVVVALHESLLDVPALLTLPLELRFAARDEVFSWPLVGPAITRLGHLCIRPESGAAAYRHLLTAGRAVLAGGESLALFPQGSVLGVETAFQRGAFTLARHLRAPLLPVVLTGGHRVWEHPFTPTLRYGQTVGLRVLPPVPVPQVLDEPPDVLRSRMQREMKRVALSGSLPAPRRYDPERDGYWDGYRFDIDPAFPEVRDRIEARRLLRRGATA
ncbi:lysophospholipid acyltransferase family protein [Deinococcus planocerae]|uniref:lysophospholipid acyltransferase family protein n=1 Tax=Deinococcus planocerae TaxID=1737569 RepID=UPI001FE81845|nr:lysophospholipid acyltransferase family protein [Deinococcus planocerae]